MDAEKQYRDSLTIEQQPSPEDWQAKVDRLQDVVCILLIKNQTMRMALSTEKTPEKYGAFF